MVIGQNKEQVRLFSIATGHKQVSLDRQYNADGHLRYILIEILAKPHDRVYL